MWRVLPSLYWKQNSCFGRCWSSLFIEVFHWSIHISIPPSDALLGQWLPQQQQRCTSTLDFECASLSGIIQHLQVPFISQPLLFFLVFAELFFFKFHQSSNWIWQNAVVQSVSQPESAPWPPLASCLSSCCLPSQACRQPKLRWRQMLWMTDSPGEQGEGKMRPSLLTRKIQ